MAATRYLVRDPDEPVAFHVDVLGLELIARNGACVPDRRPRDGTSSG